jgi:hypothetical protein
MSTMPVSSMPHAPKAGNKSPLLRAFYLVVTLGIIATVLVGFQHFYFKGMAYPGRPMTPPTKTLITAHGLTMALWVVLLLVQTLLISARKHKVHMTLGLTGMALVPIIVVLGVMAAVQSARVNPPDMKIWNMTPKPFLTVPLLGMVLFGGLVGPALWWRKKPELHRSFIIMGTIGATVAAANRIEAMNNLYIGTIFDTLFGPFFPAVVAGVLILALRSAITKRFDKWLAIATGIVALGAFAILRIALTQAWDSFASWLMS